MMKAWVFRFVLGYFLELGCGSLDLCTDFPESADSFPSYISILIFKRVDERRHDGRIHSPNCSQRLAPPTSPQKLFLKIPN